MSATAPEATAGPPARQDLTSAVLTANRLLKDLPTVRALRARRAANGRPSIALVRRIHARVKEERAGRPAVARGSPGGWTLLEVRPQTTGSSSFWKISWQDSGEFQFYLFEHYLCVRAWTYEGPSYVYVVLDGRPTYLGFLFGGKLITA